MTFHSVFISSPGITAAEIEVVNAVLQTPLVEKLGVGAWAIVGAGGVVVKNLPEHSIATGVPAKIKKEIIQ